MIAGTDHRRPSEWRRLFHVVINLIDQLRDSAGGYGFEWSPTPFQTREVEGRALQLETIPEIIAKKVYYPGPEAKPRDIFDIAAAARLHLEPVVNALRAFPDQVSWTRERLEKLNPEFVDRTIAQLMIMPAIKRLWADSLDTALAVLDEVLSSPKQT